MGTEYQNIYRQVYNVREDEHLLAETDNVTCVLSRRGLLAAAYSASNELLSIHYAAYGKERPVWELDFFEQLFAQEPLLVRQDKIKKVFVLTSSNLIIPEELYDAHEAKAWFDQIHFSELNDSLEHYQLQKENAWYVYSIPHGINELVKINCRSAAVMPLPTYQLSGKTNQTSIQCFITCEQACVTIHNNNKLLWHRVFDYAAAEDIAYEIRLICKEQKLNADKLTISCDTMSATEYATANALSQYFTAITDGIQQSIKGLWQPTLSFVKQLATCA